MQYPVQPKQASAALITKNTSGFGTTPQTKGSLSGGGRVLSSSQSRSDSSTSYARSDRSGAVSSIPALLGGRRANKTRLLGTQAAIWKRLQSPHFGRNPRLRGLSDETSNSGTDST